MALTVTQATVAPFPPRVESSIFSDGCTVLPSCHHKHHVLPSQPVHHQGTFFGPEPVMQQDGSRSNFISPCFCVEKKLHTWYRRDRASRCPRHPRRTPPRLEREPDSGDRWDGVTAAPSSLQQGTPPAAGGTEREELTVIVEISVFIKRQFCGNKCSVFSAILSICTIC